MALHPCIAYLSDVPEEPLRAPAGTFFGGARQRVGTAVPYFHGETSGRVESSKS